jgi:hypothetical protein
MYRRILVYLSAVLLHPAFKWEYFEAADETGDLTEEDLQLARTTVRHMWLEQYMCSPSSPTSGGPDALLNNPIDAWRARKQINAMSKLSFRCLHPWLSLLDSDDEFDRYESTPADPSIVDAWHYWQNQ